MKFKRTRKFFASCFAGFLAQTDSPGTPERTDKFDVNEAFRQIEYLTHDRINLFGDPVERINKIAREGYRAATK